MKTIEALGNVGLRTALEALKDEVSRIAGAGARMIVYGSYARGEEREDSDVDIMVVLPDDNASFKIQDEVRNAVYDAGFELDKHFSVIVVTELQVRKHSGFMVFGSVEREGLVL